MSEHDGALDDEALDDDDDDADATPGRPGTWMAEVGPRARGDDLDEWARRVGEHLDGKFGGRDMGP